MPLDKNESYWMLDDELIEAVRATGAREFSRYPDYDGLRRALAQYVGVAPEQILITPGSDAAIEHIARTYAGRGGRVALPVPTFYGYEPILERVGAQIVPIVYEERDGRFIFPLAGTLKALDNDSIKILFLCHPNNPLGCPLSDADISALAEEAHRSAALVVVDEAYFEFSSGTTFLPYLDTLPNLVVMRTLSKTFSLAGARVGYAIATQDTIQRLQKEMLPWPIAHPSVSAALALLAHADKVNARRALVTSAREAFREMLMTIHGIVVYPSETNFLLVRVPNAERVHAALAAQGVKVALGEPMSRVPAAKMLLKDTLRIAIPAPESFALFIEAFRKALS